MVGVVVLLVCGWVWVPRLLEEATLIPDEVGCETTGAKLGEEAVPALEC
jgi:hypothetical protein